MNLSVEIENLKSSNNIDYIDAVVLLSEAKGIEIELLADNIKKDPVLVAKIQYEAENLNILKKGARLPI